MFLTSCLSFSLSFKIFSLDAIGAIVQSSFFKMNNFSAEVFGQDKIPFLSVQHKAVIEPKACIKFSVLDKYSPCPIKALIKELVRDEASEACLHSY